MRLPLSRAHCSPRQESSQGLEPLTLLPWPWQAGCPTPRAPPSREASWGPSWGEAAREQTDRRCAQLSCVCWVNNPMTEWLCSSKRRKVVFLTSRGTSRGFLSGQPACRGNGCACLPACRESGWVRLCMCVTVVLCTYRQIWNLSWLFYVNWRKTHVHPFLSLTYFFPTPNTFIINVDYLNNDSKNKTCLWWLLLLVNLGGFFFFSFFLFCVFQILCSEHGSF